MREIESNYAKQWQAIEGTNLRAPKSLDIECPNGNCRRSLVNIKPKWKKMANFAWTQINCAGCRTGATLFLMRPPTSDSIGSDVGLFIFPAPSLQATLEPGLSEISPSFTEILAQVQEAEALGLDSLVGVGYRKALEFLIKDYLRSKHPEDCEKIASQHLAQSIREYVTDPNLKDCAERAVWLGNDETHYVRKWSEQDIDDLKTLLKLTRYWLSSEYLTAEYRERMNREG